MFDRTALYYPNKEGQRERGFSLITIIDHFSRGEYGLFFVLYINMIDTYGPKFLKDNVLVPVCLILVRTLYAVFQLRHSIWT